MMFWSHVNLAVLGITGLALSIGAACWLWQSGNDTGGFQNTLRGDHYALFFAVSTA